MSVNLNGPARGLINTLNPGGSWDSGFKRTGGTWVGNIAAGNCYLPSVPYQGSTPFVLVSSVPTLAEISFDGMGVNKMEGELSLVYLTRTPIEQNKTLQAIDAAMTADLDAIVNAILSNRHLSNSVTAVTEPITIIRDLEGLFREFQGTMFSYATITIPFLGLPQ